MKDDGLLHNKETKNNNLNELFEKKIQLENSKEDFHKMMTCPEEYICGNYDEKIESCYYSNGFPLIPNNYKTNSCWPGYTSCSQNHIPFPTVAYGNPIYQPNYITEETSDPFLME